MSRPSPSAGISHNSECPHFLPPKFETHVALLFQSVPVFENLDDLRDLPDRGFDVIALPMKIAGGTGGPLRVIAVLPSSH
jgi:kynurenine formamidase